MKSYHLTIQDLHRWKVSTIPSGPLRLDGTVEVATPREADVVVVPLPFRETDNLTPQLLQRIVSDLGIDERRITAFDCSDFNADASRTNPGAMLIRCNLKSWMKQKMPRSIAWPWPVEDFSECIPVPEGGFKYDVSGHMWASSRTRTNACKNVTRTLGRRADIATYTDFTGYIYDTPEGVRRRREFRRSMRESRLALCPQSIPEVFPYRFWEAMSAGRVPVLLCDGCQFPWMNKVRYEDFSLIIPEAQAADSGSIIRDWLSKHDDACVTAMGRYARTCWEDWLDSRKWSTLWTVAIEERLRTDGLLQEGA